MTSNLPPDNDRLLGLIRSASSATSPLQQEDHFDLLRVALNPDHDLFRCLSDHAQAGLGERGALFQRLVRELGGGLVSVKSAPLGQDSLRAVFRLGELYGSVGLPSGMCALLGHVLRIHAENYYGWGRSFQFSAWYPMGRDGEVLKGLADGAPSASYGLRRLWEVYHAFLKPPLQDGFLQWVGSPLQEEYRRSLPGIPTADLILRRNLLGEGEPCAWVDKSLSQDFYNGLVFLRGGAS